MTFAAGARLPRLVVVGGVLEAAFCGLVLVAGAEGLGPITRTALIVGGLGFLAGSAGPWRRLAWTLGAGAVVAAAWLYASATREAGIALLVALPGCLLAAAAWMRRAPLRTAKHGPPEA